LRGISASGLRGISASGLRADEDSQQLVFQFEDLPLSAIGTISNISVASGTIKILGQDILIDDQTIFIDLNENSGSPLVSKGSAGINSLQEGNYIVIAGEYMDPGRHLGTVVIKVSEHSNAGNSIAYLRSKFVADSGLTGSGKSGNSSVDYTAAMYNPELTTISTNDAVEYFGFETPHNPNKLFATYGSLVNESHNN
jgi:hypothetical protein